MLEKFLNLDEEKKSKIINAAMKEFAAKGYKEAKTENIAKEAGISKGLLFHYFGTKKALFDYVLDYSIKLAFQYLDEVSMDPDIFVRLKENTIIKMKTVEENPEFYNFIITVSQRDEDVIKKEAQKRIHEFSMAAYEKILGGLDYTKFKDDVDPQKAIELITWTLEGFSNKTMAVYKNSMVQEIDNQKFFDELDIYLDLLKSCLYK